MLVRNAHALEQTGLSRRMEANDADGKSNRRGLLEGEVLEWKNMTVASRNSE